jgi:phospholipid/cholesterol/gamma-HCH transport system substrate-binding protein
MEFIVGLFFFGALAILAFFTIILSRDSLFSKKQPLDVIFSDVAALSTGDKVQVRGVTIGQVDKIALTPSEVVVTLGLTHALKFYQDYKIEIQHSSVLGGQHLTIDLGTPQAPPLPSDAVLRGQKPANLINEASAMMQTLRSELDSLRQQLRDGELIPKLITLVDDLNQVSGKVRKGEGTLGKLVNDPAMYERTMNSLDSVRQAGASLQTAADNMNQMIGDVRSGQGTLGKLVTDETLHSNLLAGTNDLKQITANLKAGKGTLGKLLTDESLHANLQETTDNLKQISAKLIQGESTVAKLMHDEGKLYNTIQATFDEAHGITMDIRSGQGSLSKLIRDPALYDETRQTINRIRSAVEDFSEQAPISTFGSLIFGAL